MNNTIDRYIQTEIFFASIAPQKLSQAKAALDNVYKLHNNQNILLGLAANVSLEPAEWLRANELYGMYR